MKLCRQKKFKKIDQGRSMLEMLAVLAVIGILAIGGIIGYKLSMTKYKANKLIGEVNLARSDLQLLMSNRLDVFKLVSPFSDGKLNTSTNYEFFYGCGDGSVQGTPLDCSVENKYFVKINKLEKGVCRESADLAHYYPFVDSVLVNEMIGDRGLCTDDENSLRVVFNAEDGVPLSDENPMCKPDEIWDESMQACSVDDDDKKCYYSPSIRAEVKMSDFKMAQDGMSATVRCGVYFVFDGSVGTSVTFEITDSGWESPISADEFNKMGEWASIKEYCHNNLESSYGWLLNGGASVGSEGGKQYSAGKLARKDMSNKYSTDPFISYYMCEVK